MKRLKKILSIILVVVMACGLLSMPTFASTSVKVPTVGSVSVTSSSAGKLTVKWNKVKGVSGYQVIIARNKSFTSGVKKVFVKATKSEIRFTNLKKGSRYFAKVRAVKKVNGKSHYGKYSRVKSYIVKKSSPSNSGSDSDSSGSQTVYWTPSGEVYHSTKNCSTLSRSKTIYSGSISESGKSRWCKVCH